MFRDDVLVLDAVSAAWVLAGLELLEELVVRRGWALDASVPAVQTRLREFLGRAAGRADTTKRPSAVPISDDGRGYVDATRAGELLGISADAVRKACRGGRFQGVARKTRGQWLIPVDAVIETIEVVA